MIKEGKEKQREKNGSTTTVKTELPSSQAQPSETTVKEEPGTESQVNGGEEGEKKNGVRVNSGNGAAGSSTSCGHTDIKPNLVGSTNTGTVTMNTVRSSSATHTPGDLCMVDSTTEATKSEEATPEKPVACNSVKTEINGSSNHEFPAADPCNEGIGIALSSSGPPPNGVQPLPSNVINKQPGTMEAQYMQQQSQIFVFSTALANKSAEAVLQGQYPSIIAYHCAQPGTKKYLEKHPLKMNQFNRQNPAQWLNSLAQMKQKAGPGVMKGLNPLGVPGGVQGDMGANSNSGGGMGMWNQNNSINSVSSGSNAMMQPCSNNVLPGCPVSSAITQGSAPLKTPGIDSPCMMPGSPNANPMLPGGLGHHSPSIPTNNPAMIQGGPSDIPGSPIMNPSGALSQPTLTGVKVPDENLTPQQRQHREEQLATLRKMQQMLFPEHQSPMPEGGSVNQPTQPDTMLMQHGMGPVMNMAPGAATGPTTGLGTNGGTGVVPQKPGMLTGMGGPGQITPTSVAAQIEWQKLQHQFYEERKKKGGNGMVMGGSPVGPTTVPVTCTPRPAGSGGTTTAAVAGTTSTVAGSSTGPGSVGSTPRAQGPPPPYHQTTRSASVPTAMPSPSPSSPNNPTSNLSLPSPRAASGLNSPADPNRQQFPVGSNGNGNGSSSTRLVSSGPSPSSLESPSASRPLNPSNPGTPVSTHLSPSATTRKEPLPSGSDFSALTPGSTPQPSTTTANQQTGVDGLYCRTLQSMAQQKQQPQPNQGPKEPNLMPVPSPQQIQYLNTFDGQELTIQKQPNTSLKDTNIRSPTIPTPSIESGLQTPGTDLSGPRMSGPATPLTPTSMEVSSRFPATSGDLSRFPITSPHTPGASSSGETKSQTQRFPGPSPQSQGSLTPGIDPLIKPTTTEVGTRFMSSSPQMGDGMGPPRMPAAGTSSTPPTVTNPTQNFMQQTNATVGNMKVSSHFLDVSPSGNTTTPLEVSPTSTGSFSCIRSENVPLNPNGSGGLPCNGKSAHFDPITSMAQMSQQLTSSVANSPGGQNPGLMSSMPSGMLPYNSNMHSMQMNEIGNCQGLQDNSVPSAGLINTIGPGGPGNQTGPTNFVGMPMQSAPPHSYSPNSSVSAGMQCSGSVNTTPSMNQPIVHANSSASPKPGNMMIGLGPSRGSSPYTSSPVPQRMMGRPPGPNPYSGANVQVKASAPNTIQYLPAKPQTGNSGPRGPPSLDFLQRFANPLSNLDAKVPTHNLQYFPSSGQPNAPNMGRLNIPMNRPNGTLSDVNSQMSGLPGPNCGSVSSHIGNLNGPIIGPNVPLVGMNLPMSGGMVMGPGQGPGSSIGMAPLRGSLRPSGMMRMQQMGGGVFGLPSSPGQPVSEQIFGGGPNQNLAGNAPNTQIFVPGSKSSPMGLGNAPDASQPLPPSMGQANNFKNSPFIGPTTADPNYAQQFHNFQQQLYATNTRSQMNNQAIGPNQSFFVPK